MSYLPLFFVVVGIGLIAMGLVSGGLFVLSGAGILYMCDVAVDYFREVR